MKATELRIGNFVKFQGEIIEIDGIDKFNIHWGNGNFAPITINGFFQPIRLTEEWLEKYKTKINTYFDNDGEGMMIISNPYYVLKLQYIKLEYLHTLQNLYFALTGEELTIKE